jgi:hypothetical protein
MDSNDAAIFRTLLYADLFDFPLTDDEVWKYCISKRAISKELIRKRLSQSLDFLSLEKGYVFLPGRKNLIQLRQQRERASEKKLALAKKIVSYLAYLPTIMFVGVSGAVAIGNAKKEDDIDLFIIVRQNTIWISRLLCLCLLAFIGRRRKRNSFKVQDMFCPNMFLDEAFLTFPQDRHDLYTAHEIVQLVPLLSRENTYTKFLRENSWVESFLPHAYAIRIKESVSLPKVRPARLLSLFTHPILIQFAKSIQLLIMKKPNKEIVSDSLLAFHPMDYRDWVLREFARRMKRYKITE